MKYMLLIYQNQADFQALSEDEKNDVMNEVGEIMTELTKSGEWVDGQALHAPETAKTIRVRGGVPAVTDGPFIEAKEQLAGLCVFECDSVERAVEIGKRWPDARYWAVEIRPLIDIPAE
ncbi:hypothetical protein Prum_057570 [Phytohabitans rumicis]|uniref:YCII-related domain-containing protein n=2 Tax=Phytohabitans rumicis TaxID=1076125 RepID=A0A6V8LHK3_9ACTN|nr:hypothetical protein Prum_057570 [Phytohabitans rumicis]